MEIAHTRKAIINDLVMFLLAVLSVCLLSYEVMANSVNTAVVHAIDLGIASICLLEFLWHFYRTKDKTFFLKHRWWELLAAIPVTTQMTQSLRILMLGRFIPLLESFRFIRLAVRLKLLLDSSRKYTKHTFLIFISLLVILIMFLGAVWFHYFEYGVNPHIHNYFDSIWWAIVTMTTIGYGDIYPMTTGGRIVAIFLMFTGIGTLGAFIATINSYFIHKESQQLSDLYRHPVS